MTIINMSGGKAGKPPVYQARTVQPTTFPMSVQPQQGYDALSQVTVNAPVNLLAQNIRKDVNIAGVVGTYEATAPTIKLQQKMFMPDRTGKVITPDEGYDGLSQVMVQGDPALKPENIRKGENIFGVWGTYEGASAMPTISTRVASCAGMHFDNGNAFPVILVGSNEHPTTASDGYSYTDPFPATSVTGCYVRGKWGYYSAGQLNSSASTFAADTARGGYRFFGGYSWRNTARSTASMDYFLRLVAEDLREDYFSGTMNCQPYAVADTGNGDYQWLLTSGVSFGDDTNVPVNFTYSNGNVSYSISSSDLRDAGNIAFGSKWYWFSTSSYPVSYAKPCLVFSDMLVEI